MSKSPKVTKVCITIVVLLISIGLGVYFIQRDGCGSEVESDEFEPEKAVYLQLRSGDPEQVARAKERNAEYDRAMGQLLSRHPSLKPQWKNIPPEKNGYLQLIRLAEKRIEACDVAVSDSEYTLFDFHLDYPNVISDAIHETGDYDSEAIGEYLAKEADLLSELRRIGLMAEQSAHGVNIEIYEVGYPASFIKGCVDVLCLDARWAAERGDKERAVTSLSAAHRMVRHQCQIEVPSLIHETVGVLTQLTVLDAFTLHDKNHSANWTRLSSWSHRKNSFTRSLCLWGYKVIFIRLAKP